MKTLSVTISDIEYNKFGISNEQMNFTDFVDIISRELMRQNLNRNIALAEKYGLSSMTDDHDDDYTTKDELLAGIYEDIDKFYANK